MHGIAFFIFGFTALLMQVTVIRRLMTVFSGNELTIGITLSVWLSVVGIGSIAGSRIGHKRAFPLSFLVVAFLAQPTILFIGLIRPLVASTFGETIPLVTTYFSALLVLTPLCLAVGAQFPLAVAASNKRAALVYGLEAVGACAAGLLFTLLLSGRIDALTLATGLSLLCVMTASLLLRSRVLALLLLLPFLLHPGIEQLMAKLAPSEPILVEHRESRYGEIEVMRLRDQLSLYSSGSFLFAYPDPQTEELKTHLVLSLHPDPKRVLLIGGSMAMAREVLKYPVANLEFVEVDPKLIAISIRLLTPMDRERLRDPRLALIADDARRFIAASEPGRYDLVVMNLPEPTTANLNRFYTIEFFELVRKTLAPDGMLVSSLPPASGYIGKRMQALNGSIYHSLEQVFPEVVLSSEEYGIMAAAKQKINSDPAVLGERFVQRRIVATYFDPSVFNDAFSGLKTSMVKARLGSIRSINRDTRPVAYLYNLMLWLEAQGSRSLLSLPEQGNRIAAGLILVIVGASVFFWKRKQPLFFSVAATGYAAMAMSLSILLAYQAAYGYVYEMIGALTAAFMAGTAFGALVLRSLGAPLMRLRLINGLTIALLLCSSIFFRHEAFFYVLSVLLGMAAGAEFTAAMQAMAERGAGDAAGGLYAADLTGGMLGALMTTLLLVPLFGIENTVLFVVLLKAAALVPLFSLQRGPG